LIRELRERGPEIMEHHMDSDQSFRVVLQEKDSHEDPSFYAKGLGLPSEDRAVAKVQDWSMMAIAIRSSSIGIGALLALALGKEPFSCRIGP